MSQTASCVVVTETQAQAITTQLRSAGFYDSDISLLFPHEVRRRQVHLEKNSKVPEGAAIGAGTGGAVGAALGWLVGIGTLAIPGLGPVVAAGPILAALSGVAAGAAVGGLTGSLVGLGIPEIEAKVYERNLQEGNYLISVRCSDEHDLDLATDIFRKNKAKDISAPRTIIAGA